MLIRNRLISFIYRLVCFIGMIVLLIYYFSLSGRQLWQALCYFGPEVMLTFTILLGAETAFNGYDLRNGIKGIPAGVYMPISLCIKGYVLVSSLSYLLIVIPIDHGYTDIELIIHLLILVIALVDYLCFDLKGTVKYYVGFNFVSYPLLYGVFLSFRPLVWPEAALDASGNMYPYSFFNPSEGLFFLYALLAIVAFLVVGYLLIFINNLLGGKYSRKRAF